MNEFTLITNYFAQQKLNRKDVVLGIGDDCALISPPPGHLMAITTDTLNEHIHFLATTLPEDIGYKAMAVNLSDLAAMGATPAWFTLALSLPDPNPDWLMAFSAGMFELANRYQVQLIGGDLTRGPLAITMTAMGCVSAEDALLRRGAKPGDYIYVSGELGGAGLALHTLRQQVEVESQDLKAILRRLNRPTPQVRLGQALLPIANSCIDISDGLAQDLNHILNQSQVGAELNVEAIPILSAVKRTVAPDVAIALALNAGDDYELCFTVPPEKVAQLAMIKDYKFTLIGKITADTDFKLMDQQGNPYHANLSGFSHF